MFSFFLTPPPPLSTEKKNVAVHIFFSGRACIITQKSRPFVTQRESERASNSIFPGGKHSVSLIDLSLTLAYALMKYMLSGTPRLIEYTEHKRILI